MMHPHKCFILKKNQTTIARKKSFFSKKVSKSHFSAQNEAYIFNTQNFITNETSLKTEGEVSSKYHKLARSIMIFLLASKKKLYEVITIAFLRQ